MLYFIVNEKSKSGNAKQIWKDIEEVLKVRNVSYQVFVSEYRGHAGKLAGEICAMDDDDICLVGDAGTLQKAPVLCPTAISLKGTT